MQTLGAENSHSVKIQDKIGTFEQHDFSRQCCLSLIRRKFVVSIGKLRHPAPLTFLRHEWRRFTALKGVGVRDDIVQQMHRKISTKIRERKLPHPATTPLLSAVERIYSFMNAGWDTATEVWWRWRHSDYDDLTLQSAACATRSPSCATCWRQTSTQLTWTWNMSRSLLTQTVWLLTRHGRLSTMTTLFGNYQLDRQPDTSPPNSMMNTPYVSDTENIN